MKRIISIATFLVLFMNAYAQDDTTAIRYCYTNFKKHFSEQNGIEAFKSIDTKSIIELDTLLLNIKYSDSLQIMKLRSVDKLHLFYVRILSDSTSISKMKPVDLFDFLVRNKLYGTYKYIDLGKIEINSNLAISTTPFATDSVLLYFKKENSTWKFYVNSIFDPEEIKLKQMLADENLNEMDIIVRVIERKTDKSFDPKLWKAPLKKQIKHNK